MGKKIVFQFVDSEVNNSLFFDDPAAAIDAFNHYILNMPVWIVNSANNAAGEKFDMAYKRDLIKWVKLMDFNKPQYVDPEKTIMRCG